MEFVYINDVTNKQSEVRHALLYINKNSFVGHFTPDLISPRFHNPVPSTTDEMDENLSLKDAVSELEKKLITSALRETNGNILKAAENLQLSRPGLHKMIKRLGLSPKNM